MGSQWICWKRRTVPRSASTRSTLAASGQRRASGCGSTTSAWERSRALARPVVVHRVSRPPRHRQPPGHLHRHQRPRPRRHRFARLRTRTHTIQGAKSIVAMGSRVASAIGLDKVHGTTFVRGRVRARQHHSWAGNGGLLSKSISNPRSEQLLEPLPSRETIFGLIPRVLRLVFPALAGHADFPGHGSTYPSCYLSRSCRIEHCTELSYSESLP